MFFFFLEQLLFVSVLLLIGYSMFLMAGLNGIVSVLASSGPPSPFYKACCCLCVFFSLSQKHSKAQQLIMLPLHGVVLSISNAPSPSSLSHHSGFVGYPLH